MAQMACKAHQTSGSRFTFVASSLRQGFRAGANRAVGRFGQQKLGMI